MSGNPYGQGNGQFPQPPGLSHHNTDFDLSLRQPDPHEFSPAPGEWQTDITDYGTPQNPVSPLGQGSDRFGGSPNPLLNPETALHSSPPYRSYVEGDDNNLSADEAARRFSMPSNDQPRGLGIEEDDRIPLTDVNAGNHNKSYFREELSPSIWKKTFTLQPIKTVQRGRWGGEAITWLVLSLYSTIFSAVFLGIALTRTRWGHIDPSTASLLTGLFSKTIELTFVTTFVACLGQVLSRRASIPVPSKEGITLAQMSMRYWVLQPATIFTHWKATRAAFFTLLGALTFVSAILALLYTTAANALVNPQIQPGPAQDQNLQGPVATSFANVQYIESQCPNPITNDPAAGASSCLTVQSTSQSFNNFLAYFGAYSNASGWSSPSWATNQSRRILPYALYHQNTTVQGSWINTINTTTASQAAGRIVNNVTMAFPHAGILNAAVDPVNKLSIVDAGAAVNSTIGASVPSPMLNVLCVNAHDEELLPIIYSNFTSHNVANGTNWPTPALDFINSTNFLNATVFDDIFQWGPKYGNHAPIFPKLPAQFNTVANNTYSGSNRTAIYILGQSGPDQAGGGPYALCSIQAGLTSQCSTHYEIQGDNGNLSSSCLGGDKDKLAYINTNKTAVDQYSTDWFWLAQLWSDGVSLGAGLEDGDPSITHILMDLKLTEPQLNTSTPSLAEALAVLGGNTLLAGTNLAQVTTGWNLTNATFPNNAIEHFPFPATVQWSAYTSGGASASDKAFFVILVGMFLADAVILVYFLIHRGTITDYSDPVQMFHVAGNTQPSELIKAHSTDAGLSGEHYQVYWVVRDEQGRRYLEAVPGRREGSQWRKSFATSVKNFNPAESSSTNPFTNIKQRFKGGASPRGNYEATQNPA